MIDHIEGKLIEKTPTYAVISCNGVGYMLNISLHTFSNMGDQEHCKLFAHLAIREDAHVLYGFINHSEREVFRKLISVSGVGANTARMILSSLSPEEVVQAVTQGDVPLLKGIKGIGEKSAQRIIVDLKGKLGKETLSPEFFVGQDNTVREEALSALLMLGFSKSPAEKALDKVLKTDGKDQSVEQLIKATLKNL